MRTSAHRTLGEWEFDVLGLTQGECEAVVNLVPVRLEKAPSL